MTHDEFVKEWRSGRVTASVNRGFALERWAPPSDRRRYAIFLFLGRFFLIAALPVSVGSSLLRLADIRAALLIGAIQFVLSHAFLGYANTQIARHACAEALNRIMEDDSLFAEATKEDALKIEPVTGTIFDYVSTERRRPR